MVPAKGINNHSLLSGFMTELIYYDDPYIREMETRVMEVLDDGIVLDSTIVFGRSCGVKPDEATFTTKSGTYTITDRREESGQIIHILEEGRPRVGEKGILRIDWARRFSMMKLHTTLHILSSVVLEKFNVLVTGSDITPEKAKIDFDMDRNFTKEELQLIEDEINRIIKEDHRTTSGVISPEEAEKIPGFIRSKSGKLPQGLKELRYTKIEDVDMQADGGIHVRSTSEIGGVKIVKQKNKGRGRRRLEIVLT